jgi:DNA repair exonuclease SbcCD nuclease subunit
MKFIHTADIHLGKSFAFLGDKGSLLREVQIETLEKIAHLAQSESVDFLIIAGDLFESNAVSSRLVRKTTDIFKSIDPIPVLVSPGTHDLLDEGSVYRRKEFQGLNIKVFGIEGTVIKVKDAAIHGRANDTKQGGVHPLRELKPDTEAKFNIAVIHASVEIEGKANPDDYLVSTKEIAASGMDYVALGHWHRMNDFSNRGIAAWYSGSPEATTFDEADKAGHVLLVNLGEKTTVEPKKVGQYEWLDKTLDVTISMPGDLLNSEIKKLSGEKVLLRLQLKGTLPQGHDIDANLLEEEFADSFFYFAVNTSKVGYPVKKVEQLFAVGTIGYLYVSRLKELIKQAETGEEKALLREALYLGASYIAKELEVD